MWLTCKKSWIDNRGYNPRNRERISVGKRYKVLSQYTDKGGRRTWCFEIPQPEVKQLFFGVKSFFPIIPENPIGSGWFDIDEHFITPEEERELKINQIIENDILGN
jgi:hypothetical protein